MYTTHFLAVFFFPSQLVGDPIFPDAFSLFTPHRFLKLVLASLVSCDINSPFASQRPDFVLVIYDIGRFPPCWNTIHYYSIAT